MPKFYSEDLRERILSAYLSQSQTIEEIGEQFGVSISTVKRITQRYRTTGTVKVYLDTLGRHSVIDDKLGAQLKGWLSRMSDMALAEIKEKIQQTNGLNISLFTLWRCIKNQGLNYKKKSFHASQRDREDVKKENSISNN